MRKRVGLVFSVVASLLLAESGIRIMLTRIEYQAIQNPVPDAELVSRLPPNTIGHDARGFRNRTVAEQVDVVVVGDSQTWGVNARRRDAWPQTLGRLSGSSVYNMAVGGYGPVQYWVLTQEAVRRSPDVIVVGLYFGNDLWDAYSAVYLHDAYAQFRDGAASGELYVDTIQQRAQAAVEERVVFRKELSVRTNLGWLVWLGEQTAIGRALSRRGRQTLREYCVADKAWALAHPEHAGLYENGSVRTVFTPSYRLLALDLDDPRIAEGLRISGEMLLRIQEEAQQAGTGLVVVLIPTKELVYADAMQTSNAYPDSYAELVRMERHSRSELIALLEENGIQYVDALQVFEAAVGRNERIYRADGDGHPLPHGYDLIASAVDEFLEDSGS